VPFVIPWPTSTAYYLNRANKDICRQIPRPFISFFPVLHRTRGFACIDINPFSNLCQSTSVFDCLCTSNDLFCEWLTNTQRSHSFHRLHFLSRGFMKRLRSYIQSRHFFRLCSVAQICNSSALVEQIFLFLVKVPHSPASHSVFPE
jgi:hypothetical protein